MADIIKYTGSRVVSFRMPNDDYGDLVAQCHSMRLTVSEWINLMISNYGKLIDDYIELKTEIFRYSCSCLVMKNLKEFVTDQGWELED